LVRFFARSTSSTTPAMAVAAIGEVAGLGRVLPDHHALAAVSRITPYPGLVAVPQLREYRAVGDIPPTLRTNPPQPLFYHITAFAEVP
jgi:hypothetical protein